MEMKLLQFMQLIRLKRYHQWMAYIRMHVVNNMKRAMVCFQHLFTPPICHRLFIQGGKNPLFSAHEGDWLNALATDLSQPLLEV